jgi:HK97 family phage portal protein
MSIISLNIGNPAPQAIAQSQPYNLASLTSIFTGTRTFSGQYVTQETAMRASAVLACIRILSEDISQLPLHLYRRGPRGSSLATDHPLYRLLHDAPNAWQTSLELREAMVLDLLLYGQCFVEKQFGRNGIEALYPLAAGRMMFKDTLADGTLRWQYSDPKGSRVLLADDLWRVNLLSAMGSVEGRSLVLLAREAIGLALAAEEQGARLFSNGIQSDLVLNAQGDLGEDQVQQLKKSLRDAYATSQKAFTPLLLTGDIEAKRIGLTAQESQYIESRSYQLSDIARIFRVPDVLLGVATGKTATFASAEQFFLSYVKHSIQPWVKRIEQTIQRDLIAPSDTGLYAKHDLDALLRADLQTRYNAHKVGIEAGFLTRNEAREIEDLPALEGLDTPLSPLNMGTGNPTGPAGALARQLAKNCVAHEERLLADGKSTQDVYGKMLPAYLRDKAGLPAAKCAEYCAARMTGSADGVELLTQFLIAG